MLDVLIGILSTLFVTLIIYLSNRFLQNRRVKVNILYENSFHTTFKNEKYLILKVEVINNNDFDVKNLSFETEPMSLIVENLTVPPKNDFSSNIIFTSSRRLIEDSLGCEPLSVENRDSLSGSLIFKTDESIKQLIVSYQDKKKKVKIGKIENSRKLKERR